MALFNRDLVERFQLKRQRSKYCDTVPKRVIAVKDIERKFLDFILSEADEMKQLVESRGGDDRLKNRMLALVFFEPSTRTSCSFNAAMQRLGGSVMVVNEQSSSAQKGETIEDTIQTVCCYCDAIVIRHPMKGSSEIAAAVATKPLINAGDGIGEHPTQALLDAYTIKSELGDIGYRIIDGVKVPMTVVLVGDLKHGRTVHSLVRLLTHFAGIKLVYVSPKILAVPPEIIEEINSAGIEQVQTENIEEVIGEADVLYVTRIQKERFNSVEEYEAVCDSYCINKAIMEKAKSRMIVMHPLPRVREIAGEVDADPRAAYFRQMKNGMYVRMALLDAMINDI